MKLKYALFFVFLVSPLVSSCIDRRQEASRKEVESIAYFNSGDIDRAVSSAKRLWWYDKNGSNYLLGQYAVYMAAKDGENFSSGLNDEYKRLLSIEESPYLANQYLAAKTFSWLFLVGNDKALDFLTGQCKVVLHLDPKSCAWSVINKLGSPYLTTHEDLDAVSLYEASRVAHDLSLIDDYDSRFFMAMALIRMDKERSDEMIKNLESVGHFNSAMKGAYCTFLRDDKVNNVAVHCSDREIGGAH
jgi:hypothetical protein